MYYMLISAVVEIKLLSFFLSLFFVFKKKKLPSKSSQISACFVFEYMKRFVQSTDWKYYQPNDTVRMV